MLWGGVAGGGLELRRLDGGGVQIAGRFPYGVKTEMAPGRFEVIAPRAFAARIDTGEDVHLLSGHDFEKPLASRAAGTLDLHDSDDALTFEARVSDATTWARDFLAAHDAGLIRGLSPGFRVPANGERVERRGQRVFRTVFAAELIELSAVTRPAYDAAQVQARRWKHHGPDGNRVAMLVNSITRWRA